MVLFTFRRKVLLLALTLVAGIQLITLFPVLSTIKSDVDQRAHETVGIAGTVFDELMASRGEQLLTTVDVLVSDFGFKQAVATGESSTIRSVLINHSARVEADIAMLLDLEGKVLVSSQEQTTYEGRSFANLLAFAANETSSDTAIALDGAHYQTVTVPLRAPVTIAWVVMGFRIDETLAARIASLTDLEVSFISWNGHQQDLFASTLPGELRPPEHPGFLSLQIPFLHGSEDVYVMLQLSMHKATASYRRVRTILLIITSLALLIALSGAFWLARTVTRPVSNLVAAARRMREGIYTEPIALKSKDELGELASGFNLMQQAISDREARIVHQAQHDSLSGLPNRDLVLGKLGEAMAEWQSLTVVSLSIDRFSRIASSLGHRAADEVIKLVAGVLQDNLREDQILGHLGGNEFIIARPGYDAVQSIQWVEHLSNVMHAGVQVQGANISLRAAAGVASFPDHGADAEQLLRCASIARSDAGSSREPVAVYQTGQEERHLQQIRIVGDFPQALENDQLRLAFQPKINCRTQEIQGAEALIRWQHPELGLLLPYAFVDAIEQAGSIAHLSRWVIREAVSTCRQWRNRGLFLSVAVNLSVDDLLDEYLPYYLLEVIKDNELPSSALTLEVTESAIMRNVSQALVVLGCIKDVGFRVSIDDFGTGHSSLAQLKRLPLTELKIDKSFVMNIDDSRDEAIIRATIELAHHLGLNVVAEGVENAEALRQLRELGCEYAQGYYISRPVDVRRVRRLGTGVESRQQDKDPGAQNHTRLRWGNNVVAIATLAITYTVLSYDVTTNFAGRWQRGCRVERCGREHCGQGRDRPGSAQRAAPRARLGVALAGSSPRAAPGQQDSHSEGLDRGCQSGARPPLRNPLAPARLPAATRIHQRAHARCGRHTNPRHHRVGPLLWPPPGSG